MYISLRLISGKTINKERAAAEIFRCGFFVFFQQTKRQGFYRITDCFFCRKKEKFIMAVRKGMAKNDKNNTKNANEGIRYGPRTGGDYRRSHDAFTGYNDCFYRDRFSDGSISGQRSRGTVGFPLLICWLLLWRYLLWDGQKNVLEDGAAG